MNYLKSFVAFSLLWTVSIAVEENQNNLTNEQRDENDVSKPVASKETKFDLGKKISSNFKHNETENGQAGPDKNENGTQSLTSR